VIVCLGDVFLDVHVRQASGTAFPEPLAAVPGGAAANTASWLASGGTLSGLIGSVGKDVVGDALVADLQQRGVHTAVSCIVGMSSGICVVARDASGHFGVRASRGANDVLLLDDPQRRLLLQCSWLHVSAYAFFAEASRAVVLEAIALAREHGAPVSLDLGAPHLVHQVGEAQYVRLLQAARPRVLFANDVEAAMLAGAGDPVDAVSALAEIAIVKRGGSGCIVHDGRTRVAVDAFPAEEIDPTGAGDAFAAGTIAALAAGRAILESVRAGAALGARCVAVVGGRPPSTGGPPSDAPA
jgi:ribokinase